MRFLPIIAHGAGLLSTFALMVVSAIGALICFIIAVVSWIAQRLGLP